MEGKGLLDAARLLGREGGTGKGGRDNRLDSVRTERWKIYAAYEVKKETSQVGWERSMVRGPDRRGQPWTRQEARLFHGMREEAKDKKQEVPIERMMQLFGRTANEIREHIGQNTKGFF